jgi:transposase-like protein
LGAEVCARAEQTDSTASKANERFLEGGRDVYQSQGRGEVFVPAVDSKGNTLDFMLSAKQDGKAAARFLRKVLKSQHTQASLMITVDKNAAYPVAIDALKADETMEKETELRQGGYLNNGIEQEHRSIKRIVKPMMGFKTFNSARRTLRGIEAMNF